MLVTISATHCCNKAHHVWMRDTAIGAHVRAVLWQLPVISDVDCSFGASAKVIPNPGAMTTAISSKQPQTRCLDCTNGAFGLWRVTFHSVHCRSKSTATAARNLISQQGRRIHFTAHISPEFCDKVYADCTLARRSCDNLGLVVIIYDCDNLWL